MAVTSTHTNICHCCRRLSLHITIRMPWWLSLMLYYHNCKHHTMGHAAHYCPNYMVVVSLCMGMMAMATHNMAFDLVLYGVYLTHIYMSLCVPVWSAYMPVCVFACMYVRMHEYVCQHVCMYVPVYYTITVPSFHACMPAWLPVCVCGHVCLACMYDWFLHVCVYGSLSVCIYACICVCMYARMAAHMYVCVSAWLSACVCMYVRMYVHCMYQYVCMHACMCVGACLYACLPAWMPPS